MTETTTLEIAGHTVEQDIQTSEYTQSDTRGGYNAYYMIKVWYCFTDTQQTDMIGG